jgi:uncharacterized BrkB/YihY/UPF0761 family membrane protein
MSWKNDAKEAGRYALALLAGFILFPLIIVLVLVIASIASVPVALIGYTGITNNNPALVGIGITIVFVVVGIVVWIVYKILKRVVDLIWQR